MNPPLGNISGNRFPEASKNKAGGGAVRCCSMKKMAVANLCIKLAVVSAAFVFLAIYV